MSGVLSTVGKIAGVVSTVAMFIPGGQPIAAAAALVATAASVGAQLTAVAPPRQGSVSQTTIGSDQDSPWIVGRTYYGGARVQLVGYGATLKKVKNPYLLAADVHSVGGPVDGLEAIYADLAPIAMGGGGVAGANGYFRDHLWRSFQLGQQVEGAALPLRFAGAPGWGAAARLSGKAAIAYNALFDRDGEVFASGFSQMGAVWRGARCWNPVEDSTYPGGAGASRWAPPGDTAGHDAARATWSFTRSPGLLALRYALGIYERDTRIGGSAYRKTFGAGIPLDGLIVEQFVHLHNVCTANRWNCDGMLFEPSSSKWDNLKRILAAGGAEPCWIGGRLGVRVNAPRIALDTITASDLAEGEIVVGAMQGWEQRLNTIVPKYRSETHRWEYVATDPVQISTYLAEDGEEKREERQYDLVQDPTQARQLAAYELLDRRELGEIELPCKPRLRRYGPGDLLYVNLPDAGLVNQPAVVLRRTLDPATMGVTLVLRGETMAKHDFALGRTGTPPPTPALVATPSLDEIALERPVSWDTISDPIGTKPADNATNGADPNSPFGPDGKTVGEVRQTLAEYDAVVAEVDRKIKEFQDKIDDIEAGGGPAADEARQAAEAARDAAIVARDATIAARDASRDRAIEAAQAAGDAEGYAVTASGSADLSSRKATEAGEQAALSRGQADIAATAAGKAEASEGLALQSERNAKGSENEAARYQALTVTTAEDANLALAALFPRTVRAGAFTEVPLTLDAPALPADQIVNGRIVRRVGASGYPYAIWTRGLLPYVIGRLYRFVAKVEWVDGYPDAPACIFYAHFYRKDGSVLTEYTIGYPVTLAGNVVTDISAEFLMEGPSEAAFMRLALLVNRKPGNLGDVTGGQTDILALYPEDITADRAAASSAAAAVTSAETAKTEADASGVRAEAARLSALDASGSKDGATYQAGEAAKSAVVASDKAAAATRSQEIVARYSAAALDEEMALQIPVAERWSGNPVGAQAPDLSLTKTTAWNNVSCMFFPGNIGAAQVFSTAIIPVDTSKKYKISARIGAYATGSTPGVDVFYVGFVALNADGAVIDHGPYGSYRYAATLGGQGLVDGQIEQFQQIVTGEGNDSWTKFPPGTRNIRLLVLMNWEGGPLASYVDYLRWEDVDGVQSALAAVRDEADARVQQGVAYANRTGIVETAIYARTPAAVNANANLSYWPDVNGLPVGWAWWSAAPGAARRVPVAGGRGYGFGHDTPADVNTGLVQNPLGMDAGWWIFEAETILIAGTYQGAGMTVDGIFNFDFSREEDTNGVIGVYGYNQRRRWSKMFYADRIGNSLHLMNNWGPFAPLVAKNIEWYACGVRPASAAEIAARKAIDTTIPAVAARVQDAETTLADLPNRYAGAQRVATVEAQLNNTAESELRTGMAARIEDRASAIADAKAGAVAQTVEGIRANFEGRIAGVEVAAGAIAAVDGRTEYYWQVTGTAPDGNAMIRLAKKDGSAPLFYVGANMIVDGSLLVTGSIDSLQVRDNAITGVAWGGGGTLFTSGGGVGGQVKTIDSGRLALGVTGKRVRVDYQFSGHQSSDFVSSASSTATVFLMQSNNGGAPFQVGNRRVQLEYGNLKYFNGFELTMPPAGTTEVFMRMQVYFANNGTAAWEVFDVLLTLEETKK